MCLVRGHLLLLIIMMHISFMVSSPVGQRICEEKLDLQDGRIKERFGRLLKDLKYAENLFVERLFYNTTSEAKTKSLKPLDGITIPAGNINDSSILNSIYEISECLTSYLPEVIGNLTADEYVKTQIGKTSNFYKYFTKLAAGMEDCWEKGELKVCPKNVSNNQTGYEMKEYALGVLHTAVKWTESFIN